MTENKLYQLCREEARKIIYDNIGVSNIKYDLAQLTAEIYGMKLLEKVCGQEYVLSYSEKEDTWEKLDAYFHSDTVGTTQQLHDHLVEQFNKEEGK